MLEEQIIYYGLLAIVFFALIFNSYLYAPFWFTKTKLETPEAPELPVSVIVACRNEQENIIDLVTLLKSQNHKDFEVLLLNDNSYDATWELLQEIEQSDTRFRAINVPEPSHFDSSKKYALSLGIRAASNELILLTDADCRPKSNKWISKMVYNFYNPNTDIVIGNAPYNKTKVNWFLQQIIQLETLKTAVNYFSFSIAKQTYMGVGRNLAYRKSIWMENKGFSSHFNLRSGDDDLFIQEVATQSNTAQVMDPETFCFSEPKLTWESWMLQKRRHISSSKLYKNKFKFLLGLQYLLELGAYTSLLVLAWTSPFNLEFGVLGGMFIFLSLVTTFKTQRIFGSTLCLLLYPLSKLSLFLLQFSIFIKNKLDPSKHW
ncbi:MAG: glycosyltransferase [Flavobacteriaceae bacterium]